MPTCPTGYTFMRDGLCHGPQGSTVTPIYPEAVPVPSLAPPTVSQRMSSMSNAELQRVVSYAEQCERMMREWRERPVADPMMMGSRGPAPRCPGTFAERSLAPQARAELARRASEGTPAAAVVAGWPSWWPWVAVGGGGLLLWWITKGK